MSARSSFSFSANRSDNRARSCSGGRPSDDRTVIRSCVGGGGRCTAGTSEAFLFGGAGWNQHQHRATVNDSQHGGTHSLLLVDKVLVVCLDPEPDLLLLELQPSLIYVAICLEQLILKQLALMRRKDQLTTLLKFFAQPLELVGTLDIPSARLPCLADFATPEADVRIHVIGFLMRLELDGGLQRFVAAGLPAALPVFIDLLSVRHDLGLAVFNFLQALKHVVVRDYGLIYGGKGSFDLGGLLVDLHDPLEVILRELGRGRPLLVVLLEKGFIILVHVIHTPNALFYCLRKAYVRRWLAACPEVELVIIELALLRGWHGDLFVRGQPRGLQDCLKMVFLWAWRSVLAPFSPPKVSARRRVMMGTAQDDVIT